MSFNCLYQIIQSYTQLTVFVAFEFVCLPLYCDGVLLYLLQSGVPSADRMQWQLHHIICYNKEGYINKCLSFTPYYIYLALCLTKQVPQFLPILHLSRAVLCLTKQVTQFHPILHLSRAVPDQTTLVIQTVDKNIGNDNHMGIFTSNT